MLPWAFSVHGAELSVYVNFEFFLNVRDNTKKIMRNTITVFPRVIRFTLLVFL
jgi:hypothetical protein